MSHYDRLRAAVVQVLDAEIGDDAVVLRRMLSDALNRVEDGLSADRDTPPEKDSEQATGKDFGDGGYPADVGTAPEPERCDECGGCGYTVGPICCGNRSNGECRGDCAIPEQLPCWSCDGTGHDPAEVSGGTPHEPEQATTDAGADRCPVVVSTLTAAFEAVGNLYGYQHVLAWGCDKSATRGKAFGAHVDSVLDLLRAASAELERVTTATGHRSLPDDVEAQLIKEYAIQDELRESVGRLEEALRAIEPLLDAQFDGHTTVEEFIAKSTKLNEALDIARAALVGVEPRQGEARQARQNETGDAGAPRPGGGESDV